jgi:glutathione S-transferase
MSLTLYYHQLSSFCWKVLIALYENDTPFKAVTVNLMDPAERANFLKVWPVGKFPVIRDEARERTVPESSIIIEYLARHYPGKTALVPSDGGHPLEMRKWDRIIDLHLHISMQKIVGDRIRPEGNKDPFGVEQAKALIRTTLDLIEPQVASGQWLMGKAFTMADCAAAPALFYADKVLPFGETHKKTMAYLERLKTRPSFARVLKEAEPFFRMFPG